MRVLAMSILIVLTGCGSMTEAERDQRLYEWQEACVRYQQETVACLSLGGHIEIIHPIRPTMGSRQVCPRHIQDMTRARCVK